MFDYARSDTHFLLYIYDNMRNELLEKSRDSALGNDLIGEVLKRSKVEALQRYEHNFYDEKGGQGPGGWLSMLSRTPNLFNKEQFAVFRAVHQWRDRVARSEDEGLTFVMPKHVLFTVARIMPTDMPSLLKSYHPMSVMLRSHLGELLGVIKQAKLAGASGPELKEYIKAADPVCIRDQNENIEMGSSKDNRAPKEGRNSPPTPVAQSSQLSRVYTSQFWGSTVEENILSEPKIKAQMQLNTIRLALPLPQLTAEIFDSATSETKTTQENVMDDPGARAEHRYVKAKKYKDDDTFVIKVIKKSRKRKAAEIEDPPRPISAEPDTDEVLNNNQDYQEGSGVHSKQPGEHQNQVEPQPFPLQLTKSQRKKKARRLKKAQSIENARRLDEERQTLGSDNAEGEKAFDYASAPSVLHAAKEKNGRTGVQQSFDPYAKSLNAPNGMRKLRKEVACKSFTFKQ